MTRTCDYCGLAYSRSPSLIGKFCSYACKAAAMRKANVRHRRLQYVPAHPLAPPGGYLAVARIVLYEKIGPGPQVCHWCGRPITWAVGRRGNSRDHVIADHLDSDEFNDDPENLVPSCGPCNGTREIRIPDDEPHITRITGTRLRGPLRACETCGADFVAWETRPGRGRFCSRSCARKAPRRKAAS